MGALSNQFTTEPQPESAITTKVGKVMVRTGQLKLYAIRVVSAILIILLTGCLKVHFHRSNHVSDSFKQYQLLPGHTYYFFGRQHSPDAIVGILDGWTFQTTKWKVMSSEKQIKGIVERMHSIPGSEFNFLPNGAYIRNDQGENIGVWYSMWETPILRFTDDTTFTISDPVPRFPHSNTGGNGDNKFRNGL